jgi:outer membrane receptor protein involved in Fe transport
MFQQQPIPPRTWANKRCSQRVVLRATFVVHCCLVFALSATSHAQQHALRGTVVDLTGAAVAGATVDFRSDAGTVLATTDAEGNFAIPDAPARGTLLIRYPGFSPVKIEVTPESGNGHFQIRMTPAPTNQRLVVSTVGPERVVPVPSSQFSIPSEQIDVSGSLTLDEISRQVPGFSLFRRSGSLFANPTSQGVSLRGMGASGASRAIVLLDGIPLNDPFGGWVYWNRAPRVSIETVQVLNGGASDTYGGSALGGVVNLESRSEENLFGTIEASYGNADTPYVSFDAGVFPGSWGISAAGQALRTHGYILVPEGQRGLVDTPAGTGDMVGSLELSRTLGAQGRSFLRASSFGESRQNGTPLQTNDTRISEVDFGADWSQSRAGAFSLRLYGSSQVFNQQFSAVAADRNSETLTNRQRSPSQQVGFAAQWRRMLGVKHSITAGMEHRDMRGHSAETTFNAAGPTADVDAGGRQRVLGFFVQDAYHPARNWLLTVSIREDTWRNSRGFSSRTSLLTGTPTASEFSDRSESAFSPRLSLLRTFPRNIAVSAQVYRAFRAPTLNELYRNFRVGSVVTTANADLRAERLTGGEAGISLRQWAERLTLRGNFFWSEVADSVANVTLSTTPALITRQRQNLASTRARGVELSAEVSFARRFRLSSGYILTDSTVLSFPANTALEGLRIPQVPKHGFNVQFSYLDQHWTAGLQARLVGNQFDDDRNLLPLGRASTVDVEIARRLPGPSNTSIFIAVQNLFNNRYTIARTPVTSLSNPVLVRTGFRFDLP